MSLSHLNFATGTNDPAEMNPEDVKIRQEIYEKKMKEHFDYSRFKNTDDITKVPGLVPRQIQETEVLKAQFRRANELYLRVHPEIDAMVSVFMCKLFEDKPDDILSYAGEFFDNDSLQEIVKIEKKHFFQEK